MLRPEQPSDDGAQELPRRALAVLEGSGQVVPLVLPAAIDIGEDEGDESVGILLGQALAFIRR